MNADRVPEFRFGGRLSLDLTWTVRYRAVWPTELLTSPDDLNAWLDAVGLPAPATPTEGDLADARALRESIYRAAGALIDGQVIAPDDRDTINHCAAKPPPSPVLHTDGMRRVVSPEDRRVPAALSAIARDAIDLLTAHDDRLRRCEGPSCSLLFHDSSRPGTRRWCSTSRCGNKVNTKAYRVRRNTATDVSSSEQRSR
ncbi:MAG: CGNR zinc finger domain-containing protein [Acidimicrobiales bacterium]